MNYTEVNLDLQGLVKRIYANLLYNSTFYNFLNDDYIGEIRQTGTPMIEVLKSNAPSIHVRETKEIANALTPTLTTYDSVKVDLTDLPMDYSLRIPVLVLGAGVDSAISEAIRQKDSQLAKQIDTYGFGILASQVTKEFVWNFSTKEQYIDGLTGLSAELFNVDVYDNYRLGLGAKEYGRLVSALTSVLKFETLAGREGVDRGQVANAYGVDIFPINDNVLDGEIGYFAHPVAVVGDTFFNSMVEYNNNYPGFPGYYVLEGNVMFGAKVVRPEAIIKLVEQLSA